MTPTRRTLLLAAVLAVGLACDVLAVLLRAPAWALAGQIPLAVLLLWLSHELDQWRVVAPRVVQAAERLEAAKPPLTQDDYAALLREDEDRRRRFTATRDRGGFYCIRCSRMASSVDIRHPIWDGPFDGGGGDAVDVRRFSWCLTCDGPVPTGIGRAIRLPYLDTEPIALVPELYNRAAFHRLAQRVTLAAPLPPIPTHPFKVGRYSSLQHICDICGYHKDDPRHG